MIQILTKDMEYCITVNPKEEDYIIPNTQYVDLKICDFELYKNIMNNLKPLGREDTFVLYK